MADKINHRCFFDVDVGGVQVGRVIFELFSDICPITCENFRSLCTGEKGEGLTDKKTFALQRSNGSGGESIYGGTFKDENFTLKHDKPHLLSMANRGKDTNGSQFFITTKPAPHLDNVHIVFGQVVSGKDLITDIENQKVDPNSRPFNDVSISNCGELVMKMKPKAKRKRPKSISANDQSSEDEASKEKHKKKSEKEDGQIDDADVDCSIQPDEIPEIPNNNFLMRRTPPRIQSGFIRRNSKSSKNQVVSKSGRKIKGRGFMRFRTPSRSRSRSRSDTPPHWRQAQSKLLPVNKVDLSHVKGPIIDRISKSPNGNADQIVSRLTSRKRNSNTAFLKNPEREQLRKTDAKSRKHLGSNDQNSNIISISSRIDKTDRYKDNKRRNQPQDVKYRGRREEKPERRRDDDDRNRRRNLDRGHSQESNKKDISSKENNIELANGVRSTADKSPVHFERSRNSSKRSTSKSRHSSRDRRHSKEERTSRNQHSKDRNRDQSHHSSLKRPDESSSRRQSDTDKNSSDKRNGLSGDDRAKATTRKGTSEEPPSPVELVDETKPDSSEEESIVHIPMPFDIPLPEDTPILAKSPEMALSNFELVILFQLMDKSTKLRGKDESDEDSESDDSEHQRRRKSRKNASIEESKTGNSRMKSNSSSPERIRRKTNSFTDLNDKQDNADQINDENPSPKRTESKLHKNSSPEPGKHNAEKSYLSSHDRNSRQDKTSRLTSRSSRVEDKSERIEDQENLTKNREVKALKRDLMDQKMIVLEGNHTNQEVEVLKEHRENRGVEVLEESLENQEVEVLKKDQGSQGVEVMNEDQESRGVGVVKRDQKNRGVKVLKEGQESRGVEVVKRDQEIQGVGVVKRDQKNRGVKVLKEGQESRGVEVLKKDQGNQGVEVMNEGQESLGVGVVKRDRKNRGVKVLKEGQESRGVGVVKRDRKNQGVKVGGPEAKKDQDDTQEVEKEIFDQTDHEVGVERKNLDIKIYLGEVEIIGPEQGIIPLHHPQILAIHPHHLLIKIILKN
ncbi:NK-tumor recognition protein [Nymphon striatum]|nr:NK-tumor recognition protein [Nymphon striatum]